jgi:hypothetical protein
MRATGARERRVAMSEHITSGRELARRVGLSHTAIQKAEAAGRIPREPDGSWDVEKTRRRLIETADPVRSPLAPAQQESPLGRLKLASLALHVEAQRLALDEDKGRLMDITVVDARIDEIAGAMRDTLLNWPARVAGLIAAELGADPHTVQTLLQTRIEALLAETANRLDPPDTDADPADQGTRS